MLHFSGGERSTRGGAGVTGSWGFWFLCGHNRGVTLHPRGNYWYCTVLRCIIELCSDSRVESSVIICVHFYWKNSPTFISSHRTKKKQKKTYQFSFNPVPHVNWRNGTIVPPGGQDVSPRSRSQQRERNETGVTPTAAKLYWIIIRVQKNETKFYIKLHSEMSQCVFSVREKTFPTVTTQHLWDFMSM